MNPKRHSNNVGMWLALGIGVGVALGASFGPEDLAPGVGLGAAIALALAFNARNPKDKVQ